MSSNLFTSLKMKLFLTIALITSVLIISIFLFLKRDLEDNRFEVLKENIEVFSHLVEANVAANIYHKNLNQIQNQLPAILNNESIQYIVLKSAMKQIYYKQNFKQAIENDFTKSNFENITLKDKIAKIRRNISYKGKTVATLFFGYNLEEFHTNLEQLKSKYTTKLLYTIIFNIILNYIIITFFFSSITKIIKILKGIRGGNTLSKLNVKRNDEIGYIYSTFDFLIDRIYNLKKDKVKFTSGVVEEFDKRNMEIENIEKKFKGLYENLTIGIYRMYPTGEYKLANPALLNMLGLSSLEELIEFKDIIQGKEDSKDRALFFKNVQQNGCAIGFEQNWRRKDKSIIHVRESIRAVKNKYGKILFYDGTVEDITEKKRIEKELILSKEKSERALRLNTEILNLMSNEIRNLNENTYCHSVPEENAMFNLTQKKSQTKCGTVGINQNKTINKIDSILKMAQYKTGEIANYKTKINLMNEILENVYDEYKEAAESKKLGFSINNFSKHSSILGDHFSITQLFTNLVDNAVKFTNEGFVNINIYNDPNGILSIAIVDSGIGMGEKFLPNLFQPFMRENVNTPNHENSSGIGLALAKRYIEINDAVIQVKSVKGKGTTFIVKFVKTTINNSYKIHQKVNS